MSYRIKYFYRTGDSFHTEDTESILEFEWEDLDNAKNALARIKEHYKWFQSIESRFQKELSKPKWFNVNYSDKQSEHHLLNLTLDNGDDVQFFAPWCGYFETLYGAEIISDTDDSMKFMI